MPSSTDLPFADHPEVRPVRFDRPLAGPQAARIGAGWGDPALDAQIAEAVAEGRRQGLAQGFVAGWTAGRRAAAERESAEATARAEAAEAERLRRRERAEALLVALADAARSAAVSTAPEYEELADVLADGALAIARAALARELTSVDDDLVLRVRAAVRALAGDGRLVLRLNPADLAAIEGVRLPADAELVADPALPAGAVAVRGEVQRLRLDVPAAVAAAEEVLRS
ncbi:MAG TPA: FliH/SctL family protein [Kineosporiaceae bacterium]|nr:FliH/SctL family protein [Kineosporiaceae bacterium]